MTKQLDLLSHSPIARNTDPATSHIAARVISESGKRATQQRQVLEAVRSFPGMTSQELARFANLDRYMVARRLPELRAGGFVRNGITVICGITKKHALTWRPNK